MILVLFYFIIQSLVSPRMFVELGSSSFHVNGLYSNCIDVLMQAYLLLEEISKISKLKKRPESLHQG